MSDPEEDPNLAALRRIAAELAAIARRRAELFDARSRHAIAAKERGCSTTQIARAAEVTDSFASRLARPPEGKLP